MISKKKIEKFLEAEVKPVFIDSYTTSDDFYGMVYRIEANSYGELSISDIVDNLGGYTNNYTELATLEAHHDSDIENEEEVETVALNDWYEYKKNQLLSSIEKVTNELNKNEMFNMLIKLNNENWSEEPYLLGEVYYIKNMCGDEYLIQEAYEYELEQALENIEKFPYDLRKEILESKFEEVEDKYLMKINNVKLDAKWNEYLEKFHDEAEFKSFLYENFVSGSKIEELKADGWNIDYIENTISSCNLGGQTDIYGIVVKNEEM